MLVIVVVGSIHADFYIKTSKFPQPGETVIGNDFAIYPGGKGANQAVGCACLKTETYIIGAVGNDYLGQLLIDSLARNNVKIDYVYRASCNSGVAFIILDEETGENMIIVSPGADEILEPSYVENVLTSIGNRIKIVITQLEIPVETVYKTLKIAKSLNATTILNPAPVKPLDEDIYRYVDVMILNKIELQQLTSSKINNIDDIFMNSEKFLKCGIKIIITTLGSMGAAVVTQSIKTIIPAFKTQVVDTVGAGDAFIAGFAVALYENKDVIEATRYANATAALKIARMGAQSMPTRSEVEEFIEKAE